MNDIDISVVVPVYGCPNAVPELCRRLIKTLEEMGIGFEIILVDDCDGMGSWDEIYKAAQSDRRIKGIRFTHNCGQDRAILAGVRQAKGEYLVAMDCDLQDEPEKIPLLYKTIKESKKDIIFVRRQKRKDSFFTLVFSKLFHKIFSYLSEIDFSYELGTFLITDRKASDYYRQTRDRGNDFTMFLLWTGFPCDFIELEHMNRYDGETSYTFSRKLKYAIRAMTTFSSRLLYLPIYFGFFITLFSVVYIVIIIVGQMFFSINPEGWSTLAAAVFFFGGVIISTQGIHGIYMGNIFDNTKNRPLYFVTEKLNCDDETFVEKK